jgi:sulfate permease, SulP family
MSAEKRTLAQFIDQFNLQIFSTSFFTAFFIAILELIFVLAFTALIYSGDLNSQVPRAVGFIILGDAILVIVVAAFSSYPAFIGLQQDAPGAMQGVIAASLIAALAGSVSAQFATVTLMVVITSLMTGLLFLLLGYFKLGGLARFLPYPVIGGFLAGTGWLLIQGGIGIMVDEPPGLNWFRMEHLQLWVPGLALGILIYFVSQRVRKPYTIPLILLITEILFYVVAWISNTTITELRSAGWVLDASASSAVWEFPLTPGFLAAVDWSVLQAHLPAMIPVALICFIGLLLNSSGMEVLAKKDIDLNRELMVAGAGNFAAGLVGGLAGYQDISFTTLNRTMSGGRRLTGILAALMLIGALFIGVDAMIFIPKFVFGSVLIYLGLDLLIQWVYEAWFKFSWPEFLAVLIILATLVLIGVLEAVIIGLILAVAMFVVSYSRITVIKFAFSGREFRSRVSHPVHEQQVLDAHGSELYVMKLEGFIFFGTANAIFDALRNRARSETLDELKYCLMDFAKVSGIDSTGMLSFARMLQWSQEQNIQLVITGMPPAMQSRFLQSNSSSNQAALRFLPSLDRGLEWCENEIIHAYLSDLQIRQEITSQLNEILKTQDAERLIPYMQRLEYLAGEYLIREGGASDFIYFIHSGQVTAQLETPGQEPIRLETIYSGRAVGEISFYLGTKRTASVIADKDTVVYSLSVNDVDDMEANDPETANIFHRINVLLLSERVMRLTRTVRALERS